MPIRREHRFFYPIDWPQLSATIRFGRARSRCEGCGRPHGRLVYHLGDGRWWDADAGRWRDGRGRLARVTLAADVLTVVRTTRVVLAAAHRNHDTADNADANLAAFCQRCHMVHDRPEHQRRRWITLFRRKALGDLFGGPYPEGTYQPHANGSNEAIGALANGSVRALDRRDGDREQLTSGDRPGSVRLFADV